MRTRDHKYYRATVFVGDGDSSVSTYLLPTINLQIHSLALRAGRIRCHTQIAARVRHLGRVDVQGPILRKRVPAHVFKQTE